MSETMQSAPGNILVVDDQPDDLRLLVSLLSERGYIVRPALDGATALTAALAAPPDLILLDVQMPRLDGYATCRQLKMNAATAAIPVIFISARSEVFDKIQAFAAGGVDYISKPYEAAEVAARVETQLRLALMQQRLETQNQRLQEEIAERERIETELRRYQEQLEQLVQERTAELIQANTQLRQEVLERQRTEQRISASLHEKEILLKEVHHRVKNNLQIIASLLYLQSQKIDAPQFAELFHASQNRINSMAYVHEMLYQSDDYSRVDFGVYVRSLASSLLASYGVDYHQIMLTVNADDIAMSINLAIPCGLIVNEIISNALKHAFPNGRQGNIIIRVSQDAAGRYSLEMSDDGIGMPLQNEARTASLGLRLIDRLVKQLGGTLERRTNQGTSYHITFSQEA